MNVDSELHDRGTGYRIGVGDLIVWMTCAALALALNRLRFYTWMDNDESHYRFLDVYQPVFLGVQLASFYFFAKSRKSEFSFPVAPGHYILLLAGAGFLLSVAQMGIVKTLAPSMDVEPSHWLAFFSYESLGHLVLCGLTTFSAVKLKLHRLWMLYFVFNAVVLLCGFSVQLKQFLVLNWPRNFSFLTQFELLIYYHQLYFRYYAIWISFILAIAGLIGDWKTGRNWDLLHYIGVLSVLAITVGYAAFKCFS